MKKKKLKKEILELALLEKRQALQDRIDHLRSGMETDAMRIEHLEASNMYNCMTDRMHKELFEHCFDWCFDNDIPYFYFKDLIKGKLYLLKSKGVDVSIEKMIGLADECMKKIRMGSEEHKNRGDF